jgi:hypothetical protein
MTQSVSISEPAVLIRIPKLWNSRMSSEALYEATRGVWKREKRREGAQFALAVADGIVREVYAVSCWHPAGSTEYRTRPRHDIEIKGRWEFVGALAPEAVRAKYVDQSAAHYFTPGNANPITYLSC